MRAGDEKYTYIQGESGSKTTAEEHTMNNHYDQQLDIGLVIMAMTN